MVEGLYKDKGAYHLYLIQTEAPIARIKPTGNGTFGSATGHAAANGRISMGGVVIPLDDALEFIANAGIFWT